MMGWSFLEFFGVDLGSIKKLLHVWEKRMRLRDSYLHDFWAAEPAQSSSVKLTQDGSMPHAKSAKEQRMMYVCSGSFWPGVCRTKFHRCYVLLSFVMFCYVNLGKKMEMSRR